MESSCGYETLQPKQEALADVPLSVYDSKVNMIDHCQCDSKA